MKCSTAQARHPTPERNAQDMYETGVFSRFPLFSPILGSLSLVEARERERERETDILLIIDRELSREES